MKRKKKEINSFQLTNNCPECFAKGTLSLSFYPTIQKTVFLERQKAEVSHTMLCTQCKQQIYPVKWTDDIERVFEYYQKTVTPKAHLKLSLLSWVLVGLLVLLLGTVLYYTVA